MKLMVSVTNCCYKIHFFNYFRTGTSQQQANFVRLPFQFAVKFTFIRFGVRLLRHYLLHFLAAAALLDLFKTFDSFVIFVSLFETSAPSDIYHIVHFKQHSICLLLRTFHLLYNRL